MDLLYSRYSNPMELMSIYIEQGRFGEFVRNIIDMDRKRKQEASEKADDDRLWAAYIRSMSSKSFPDWKKEIAHQANQKPVSLSMTDAQVADVKAQAHGILKRFSPSK